jgi:hypothetical protein
MSILLFAAETPNSRGACLVRDEPTEAGERMAMRIVKLSPQVKGDGPPASAKSGFCA